MAAIPAITAGATVLGSIISGLFGSSSQSRTNATNLQIARETNAQNKELFNQQLAFAEDMWNKTNQYNDPSNVMKRYLQAGINPQLASDFGAASQPGTPSAPTMQGVTMQPIDYSWIGNSISSGVNAYFNNQLTNSATKKTEAEAGIAKVKAELDTHALKYNLMKIINDSKSSEYAKEQARIEMSILDRTQEDSVRQAAWQTKIQEQEYEKALNDIAESKLRQEAQRIANQYAPQISEASLKQYHANVAAAYAAARNSDAQAVESAARKALTDLQAEGQKLSNTEKDSIMDAIIDNAWNQADESYWSAAQSRKLFNTGYLGVAFPNMPDENDPTARLRGRSERWTRKNGRTHIPYDYSRKKSGGIR